MSTPEDPGATPQDVIEEDEPPRPITAAITLELGAPHTLTPQPHVAATIDEDTNPRHLYEGFRIKVGRRKRLKLPQQRFWLAMSLMFTVATLAIGLVLAVMFTGESRLDELKSTASIIFGPLVTLLGTSFAWYFAKNSS